jgi:nucleoside-diphosphate-sugar epimerase
VAGGTGLVGRFIVDGLLAEGHAVTVLSRTPDAGSFALPVEHRVFDLDGPPPRLAGYEALVHAALDHLPGRYRGGEGDDPAGFRARNEGGTRRLFATAREAGVAHVVFLSSRAVYGDYPAGTLLEEAMPPRPDTLYGEVKRAGEADLAEVCGSGMRGTVLRATGVYGPGRSRRHKWANLFDAFAAGERVAPRIGTEVHGADLAAAVALVLSRGIEGVFNVSDFALDRADLLAAFADLTGVEGRLPPRCDPGSVSAMSTARLRAAGWAPRGRAGLVPALREMCMPWAPGAPGLDRGAKDA